MGYCTVYVMYDIFTPICVHISEKWPVALSKLKSARHSTFENLGHIIIVMYTLFNSTFRTVFVILLYFLLLTNKNNHDQALYRNADV